MADIAQIGFSVDTNELKDAKASLDALVPSATRVDKSIDKVEKSFNDASRAANSASQANRVVGATADATDAALMNAANGAMVYATAVNRASAANFSSAGGFDVLTGKIDNNFAAINRNLSRIGALGSGVDDVGKSLRFTGIEAVNFSRQMADIGVTAAMGMNPLLIAIQQGPQLFDILQTKAAMTGATIGAVFRAAGATIWAALAPLLPFILAIAAAVGVFVGAFALGAREINKGNDDILAGLGLTEKQLQRIEKAGVSTSVTLGDTFSATFQIIGERIVSALDGPLSWLRNAWNATLDFIVEYGLLAQKLIIGGFIGSYNAIRATWSMLPAAFGDIVASVGNYVLQGLESMINKAVALLNNLLGFANGVAAKLGLEGFGQIGTVEIGRIANPNAGAARAAGRVAGEAFGEGMAEGAAIVDRFYADIAQRAREIREQALRDAAGPGDTASGGASGAAAGKTDKFGDLTKDIAAEIAMTETKTRAVNMSAEAGLRLENQQKLLNAAQQQGIKLTDAQRAALLGLADQLTAAQIALKNAEGFKEINEGADRQARALADAAAQIGIYGEALMRLKYEQMLFNQATEQGITLTEEQAAALRKRAAELASQEASNAVIQAAADRDKKFEDDMWQLERERGEIGLTGAALAAYRYETEMLAEARRRNIDLTPEEIAAIQEMAVIYGKTADEIQKMRERVDFAKGVTKGFLKDFTDGLREGKSAWDAFGDAALNALNKIIDKLLDAAFNAIIESIDFSVLMNANGNAFGRTGVQAFANGGAFTNQVVNQPTLFAFAKGGALGVMGEAGPEAIMPLQRGPDGSLGVQMYGAGSQSGANTININMPISTTLSGAVSSKDVVDLNRRAAEETREQLRREVPAIIEQYQRDGSLS